MHEERECVKTSKGSVGVPEFFHFNFGKIRGVSRSLKKRVKQVACCRFADVNARVWRKKKEKQISAQRDVKRLSRSSVLTVAIRLFSV